MGSSLIRKIRMDCPICDKTHDVEERVRLNYLAIKCKSIAYKERFYLCTNVDDDECEFETGAMLNENFSSAHNAYHE